MDKVHCEVKDKKEELGKMVFESEDLTRGISF